MFGPGGRYKKLEPIPKPKQAKLNKDKKINSQYKDIINPKKPGEPPLDPYATPVKKA